MRKIRLYLLLLLLPASLQADSFYSKVAHSILKVDFSKLADKTIAIGRGNTNWVGGLPATNTAGYSNNEFIWNDARGDDVGNGHYQYPLTNVFTPGSADLVQFRVARDAAYLYINLRTYAPCGGVNGWWYPAAMIAINTGSATLGKNDLCEGDGISSVKGPACELSSTSKFQYTIFAWNTYKVRMWDANGVLIGDGPLPDDGSQNNIDMNSSSGFNMFNLKIPLSLLGGHPSTGTWDFIAGTGFQENDMFREVQPMNNGVRLPWYPIGGDPGWYDNLSPDPDVFDLAGAATLQDQIQDLSGYFIPGINTWADLKNYNAAFKPGLFRPDQEIAHIYITVPESIRVTIEILRLDGSRANLIQDGILPASTYGLSDISWDGKDSGGKKLPAGLYMAEVKFYGTDKTRTTYKYFRIWR